MFHFYRTRSGSTEIFDILISQDSLPDAETRFGQPISYSHRKPRFHQVGTVVLIHEGDGVEFIVACKGQFSDFEMVTFYEELEMLTGAGVYSGKGAEENGWFIQDKICPD